MKKIQINTFRTKIKILKYVENYLDLTTIMNEYSQELKGTILLINGYFENAERSLLDKSH